MVCIVGCAAPEAHYDEALRPCDLLTTAGNDLDSTALGHSLPDAGCCCLRGSEGVVDG
jgi:hypothetical protein